MTQVPPGWYPDPSPPQPGRLPQQRYWDGRHWTGHVSPAVAATPYGGPGPGPTTPDGVPLSGWWPRVAAYLIDGLLVGTASSLLTIPQQVRLQEDLDAVTRRYQADLAGPGGAVDPASFFRDFMDLLVPVLVWSTLAAFLVWAVYSSLMLRFKGATVGKLALGIAVRLRDRPGRLPWSAILLRLLVQQGVLLTAFLPVLYLSLFWFPYLDSLWALWDAKRQALHDKAARTNVVVVR